MKTVTVEFTTMEDLHRYLNLSDEMPYHMDIQCGSRAVDGKSILGVLSFGLKKRLELKFYTDDSATVNGFLEKIEFCLCKEELQFAM